MAAVSAQSAGEDGQGMNLFEDGLELVTQGLTRMQKTLDQQWQEALRRHEQKIQEALHRQKETLLGEFRHQLHETQLQHEQRIQEDLQKQERKLQSDYRQLLRDVQQQHEQKLQDALRAQEQKLQNDFRQQLQAVLRQQEHAVLAKSLAFERKPEGVQRPRSPSGEEKDGKQLEARMQRLESYVEKALENIFPRVDALLSRLEKPSPPRQQTPFPSSPDSVSAEIPDPRPAPPDVPSSPRPSFTHSAPPPAPDLVPQALKDLQEAVERGKADDARRLLDVGVDADSRSRDGLTLLMLAAKGAHPSVVSLLLERKADVHATTANGNTALQFAAYSDRSGRCVALLAGAGADVNSRDASGFMPLHRAVSSENEAAVRALLKAGASRTAKDHVNCAPIDYAKNKDIRQLLQF